MVEFDLEILKIVILRLIGYEFIFVFMFQIFWVEFLVNFGVFLVEFWSSFSDRFMSNFLVNFGRILVEFWSNFGRVLVEF